MNKPLVIIESPYAGDVNLHEAYLRRCIRDSILRGEAPFASHRMYPGALSEETERGLGIECGFAWWRVAEFVAFYIDLGWSHGMHTARDRLDPEFGGDEALRFEIRQLFP